MVRAPSEPPLWYLDNNVFHRQRQWSNASGWLELDSALSKRTQTSALAPPGFNASRFNDLASPSIFPRNEPPNPAKYSSERPEIPLMMGSRRRPQQEKELSLWRKTGRIN